VGKTSLIENTSLCRINLNENIDTKIKQFPKVEVLGKIEAEGFG
jgi:hypothetical protein